MEAMARRRKRDLSAEEKRLWEHVARHVTPLPGRGADRPRDPSDAPSARSPEPDASREAGLMHSTAQFSGLASLPDVSPLPGRDRSGAGDPPDRGHQRGFDHERSRDTPAPAPARPALPAYIPPVSRKSEQPPAGTGSGGLDRKERRALRRRVREVDDRLDLHGMRQEEAHRALIRFLQSASGRDCAIVLVVTGKGGIGGPGYGDERGVLRRITPHWLRAPELKPFVVGFEEAAAHHGGAGALYVRLRRRGR